MTTKKRLVRFSRGELLRVFESTADGVHVVDGKQRIIFWNRAAGKVLGFGGEDVLGRYCYDVIAGGDYQGHPFCRRGCPTIEAAKRGRSVKNYDVCSRRADGRPVWLNVSVLAVDDPEGEGRLAVHLFRDVTRRRQAEMLAQQTLEAVSRYQPGEDGAGEAGGPYPAPAPRLTRRELEVLRLLACGSSASVVAQTLGINTTTVRNHIEHILGKLGVHSRLEAVVYAAQHKLV
ncbi:MAG: PAS domain S-box protein [Dehalococcoidia bacterium]|nr:PAS domain S-box protein [Dehalococcoidia bacterium]